MDNRKVLSSFGNPHLGGIDLDTIVEATHIINPIIDKLDLPIEDYILDCISKER